MAASPQPGDIVARLRALERRVTATGRQLFTADPAGGQAWPWIPVPLYPMWDGPASTKQVLQFPAGTNFGLLSSSDNPLWYGYIGQVSHPRLEVSGWFGGLTGTSNSSTWTVTLGSTTLGTFTETTYNLVTTVYDVSAMLGQRNLDLSITVTSSGTGNIYGQLRGAWLRSST